MARDPFAESASGGSAEFAAIVRRFGAAAVRSLRYLGVREPDVPDASQEVFWIVYRKLPEFRGDSKFETSIAIHALALLGRRASQARERLSELARRSPSSIHVTRLRRVPDSALTNSGPP